MAIAEVFIVMPFGETRVNLGDGEIIYPKSHFDDLYAILKEAINKAVPTCSVTRMDQKHGNLVSAIIRQVYSADVVVAVLTGRNPNVFFELGVRHALRRGTIMLVADRREYPFDLHGYYSEQYAIDTVPARSALTEFIVERLDEYADGSLDDSPVLDALEVAEREQWRALNHWETRRAALVLLGLLSDVGLLMAWLDNWGHVLTALREDGSDPGPQIDRSDGWEIPPGLVAFGHDYAAPGLPPKAFADAYNLTVQVDVAHRQLRGTLVPIELGTEPLDDELYAPVQNVLAVAHRAVLLFAEDLLGAIEAVVQTRRCHSIPWPGSMDAPDEVVSTTDELENRYEDFGERATIVQQEALDFLSAFSGAPPT